MPLKTEIESEYKTLISQREKVFTSVQSIHDYSKSLSSDKVKSFVPRLERLSTLEERFDDIQNRIITFNSKTGDPSFTIKVNEVQTAFEDMVFAAKAAYLEFEKKEEPQVNVSQISQSPAWDNLAKLEIAPFSGRLVEWPGFLGLFESLVDSNKLLTNVQKFQYLKTLVVGDAQSVISQYHLSEQNYALALNALKERYQNKRRLAQMYVDNICDFGKLPNGNADNLQRFLKVHTTSVNAFKALEIADQADYLFLHLALHNLDHNTRKAFESKHSTNSIPLYKQLIEFVTEACRTYELLGCTVKETINHRKPRMVLFTKPVENKHNAELNRGSGSNKGLHCPFCNNSHVVSKCTAFLALSVDGKYEFLRKRHLCFNCLGPHLRTHCKSQRTCKHCQSNKHHSLLHPAPREPKAEGSVTTKESETTLFSSVTETPSTLSISKVSEITEKPKLVLLGTAKVLIRDSCGQFQSARAVLDSGSQVSAITSSLVQKLGLKPVKTVCEIIGISNDRVKVCGSVNCVIASRYDSQSFQLNPIVLTTIAQSLPSLPVSELKDKFRHFSLADDEFYVPSKVDLLLGADIYPKLLQTPNPIMIPGEPSLFHTRLGFVLTGPVSSGTSEATSIALLTLTTNLEVALKRFWEQEEIAKPSPTDPEDVQVEEQFRQTVTRTSQGRYVVALPFKKEKIPLQNRRKVEKAYWSLKKRLSRDEHIKLAYHAFLREYLELGHMSVSSVPSDYVLPHHCVTKPTSSSTKVRVVFNASADDEGGKNLNDLLCKGPKLQKALPDLVIQFRLPKIALCADIQMMYRQIIVRKEDRTHQHIFWQPDERGPIQEFELNTVTYGLKPSPFLAQRVLQQLVIDEGHDFPLASYALHHQTYMDDVLCGADTFEVACQLQGELVQLLERGGFNLRKWSSNQETVLENVPAEHRESVLSFPSDCQIIKILGLIWDPHQDCFGFRVAPFEGLVCKRNILSYLARVFDPLGFLAPVTHYMKWFIQRLWLSKQAWDTPLAGEELKLWQHFVEDFPKVEEVKIPRYIGTHRESLLVGFCDASEKGVAACIYIVTKENDTFNSSLLVGKTRVAPLKPLRINRLELSGAHLLSRLLKSPETGLNNLKTKRIQLYTDSKTVLAWLRIPPYRLETYVANRVSDILELTPPSFWHYVKSEENPADCASRGLNMSSFLTHPLWLSGPPFLRTVEFFAKPPLQEQYDNVIVPELKKKYSSLTVRVEEPFICQLIARFSSFTRLQRTFAFVRRFIRILRFRTRGKTTAEALSENCSILTVDELTDSVNIIVLLVQKHYFRLEYSLLTSERPQKNKLISLSPFVDQLGCLRVGGRLTNSHLPWSSKHPLILPKECRLSELIIDYYHVLSLHSGPQVVQSLVQRNYWIVSARRLIRSRINKCLKCHKWRSPVIQPFMADLPGARVQIDRPFNQVGTDFAGPFLVKYSARRNASVTKAYLCLFVCLVTKAVHLEFVSGLSAEAFLAALDRFVARRGAPHTIYSDCGRNFVGAARYLTETVAFLKNNSSQIGEYCTGRQIKWQFNPPKSPNFGGLWEAAIKSAKFLLKRTIKETVLTFEEYSTLFSRIEAILNSRPLCNLREDPDHNDYLTPGHFLIGAPLLALPEKPMPEQSSLPKRWTRLRIITQSFWKRWTREYLITLNNRVKWATHCKPLCKGEIVFLTDLTSNPLNWPMGRITQLHPGKDGIVRVATVQTVRGVYTRPVNKLLRLPD